MTVDTAAKMAPMTTATKGMEREHMAWDRRGSKMGETKKKRGYFSEWMAEKLKNLGPDHVLACSCECVH